jgi:iron complex transport system substrate-binding protein
MRRTVLSAAAALPLLGLAACSSGEDQVGSGAGSSASDGGGAGTDLLPPAEGKVSYPLTLSTPWGETVLEKRPQRIASVDAAASDAEYLAAIGVAPVAAPETAQRSIWMLDALPVEIETVYPAGESGYPVEKIAASKPDLIIDTVGDLADSWEKLRAIAPVLGRPTAGAQKSSWEDQLDWIAQALDLADAAEQAKQTYQSFFTAAKEENPEFAGLTATYAVFYGGQYGLSYFSTTGSDTEHLFLELGFEANPQAEKFVKDQSVSEESLTDLAADILVMSDNSLGEDGQSEPLFQNLDVVAEDRAIIFDNTVEGFVFDGKETEGNIAWALARSGPLSSTWAAEQLIPMLRSVL